MTHQCVSVLDEFNYLELLSLEILCGNYFFVVLIFLVSNACGKKFE
jgi:hypothetical protein